MAQTKMDDPHQPDVNQISVPITVAFSTVLAIFSVCISVLEPMDATSFGQFLVSFSIDSVSTALGLASSIYLLKALSKARRRDISQFDPSFNLKVIFLWIFGIGIILQQSTYIVMDALCVGKENKFYGIVIVSKSFFIVFVVLQIILITFSRTRILQSTWTIEMCVFVVIISNLTNWLRGTVKDISNIYLSNGHLPVLNSSNESRPQNGPYCFLYSPIQSVLPIITQCTIPMHLEFQLLGTIFLFTIKGKAALPNSISTQVNFSDDLYPGRRRASSPAGSRKYLVVCAIICVIILIPFTVIHFLSRYAVYQEILQTTMLKYTYLANAGVGVISTFQIVYGFNLCSYLKFEKLKNKTFGFNDYSMVVAMTSEVIFYSLVILAVIHKQLDLICETSWQGLVMIMQIFYQTIFLMMAGQRSLSSPYSEGKTKLSIIFICGGIFNFYMWFTNTFFDLRSTTEFYEIGDLIHPKVWRVTKRVIFPFTIFYRFHTCMEFYSLYQRL